MSKIISFLNLNSILFKIIIALFLTVLSAIFFSWILNIWWGGEHQLSVLGTYVSTIHSESSHSGSSNAENFIFNILKNTAIKETIVNCTGYKYPNIDKSSINNYSNDEINICKSSKPLSLFGLFDSGDPHGFPLGFIIYGDCQLSMAGPTYYCWPTVVGYINLIIDFVFWFVFVYLIVFIKNLILKKNKLKT